MENNENNGVLTTEPTGVDTPQEPQVDYKALYEKAQRDNANLDKYNKDLKAKYQAKLTDEEKQRAEIAERETYYKSLERELSVSKIKSSLSGRVSDTKILDEISSKFADGNTLDALDILNKFENERESNLRKSIEQELLAKNPTPPPQNDNNGEVTKEQFNKMTVAERMELKNKNPELYKKYAK